ncbi:putative DNA-directed RNA polymerase, phage-type, DNA/RNA polymerase superfamily [Helianthus anomalus]
MVFLCALKSKYIISDRKLIKAIFVPIIYGKSLISTANDIKEKLSQYITRKESYTLAKVCFEFWNTKYRGLVCLIRLIKSSIGCLASAGGRPVIYQSDYFTTVQDYMKMDPVYMGL